MDWLAKLKEQAQEHVVEGIFALVLLLLGVIWAAVPTEVWGRVSAATPKRALWVAIGLLVLGLFLEIAYVAHLRRKLKLKPRFGVYWDRDLMPYCPAHKGIPLATWGNLGNKGPHGYICPEGPHVIPLQDDGRNYLKPSDARRLLQADAREMPEDAYQPDEIGLKILVRLTRPDSQITVDELGSYLRLHPDRVQLYVSVLEEKGYIWHVWAGIAGAPITYHLSDKGRAFLVSRDMI
jgi:hypothetical protein